MRGSTECERFDGGTYLQADLRKASVFQRCRLVGMICCCSFTKCGSELWRGQVSWFTYVYSHKDDIKGRVMNPLTVFFLHLCKTVYPLCGTPFVMVG